MQFLTERDFKRLSKPGVVSLQLLSPHNSQSSRVTVTRVTVQPGAGQPRHNHPTSEQIWVALEGAGTLLLADGATRLLAAGEVVRFADGDVHGVENTGRAAVRLSLGDLAADQFRLCLQAKRLSSAKDDSAKDD